MILGAPKTLADLPPFTVATIQELSTGMEQQVASGTPLDVPTMMPIGQLAQMARTLQAYHALVAEMVSIKLQEYEDSAELDAVIEEWQTRAQALLDTPAPPPPSRIQQASSLITP